MIDVLIAAHNEAANLPRLFESLRQQSVGADSFRVILVDNASTDDTQQVAEHSGHSLNLLVLQEDKPGKNVALNTGYAHVRSEYVAHIDGDNEAHRDWLAEILRTVEAGPPPVFGGPSYPYYTEPKPRWYRDRYNTFHLGDEARTLSDEEYLIGQNMVWRRDVVEALGGFRAGVGVVGRGVERGDETNLFIRARRTLPEFEVGYNPAQVVYHLTRPSSYSLWYWARRHFATGVSSSQIWEQEREQVGGIRALARLARSGVNLTVDMTLGMLTRDREAYPYPANYFYECARPHLIQMGQHYHAWRGHAEQD